MNYKQVTDRPFTIKTKSLGFEKKLLPRDSCYRCVSTYRKLRRQYTPVTDFLKSYVWCCMRTAETHMSSTLMVTRELCKDILRLLDLSLFLSIIEFGEHTQSVLPVVR